MPTYEYRCAEGHEFERFQKMTDEPISACPDCGAEAERIISGGGGLVFKGEGFYATDYRSEEYRKKASKEKKGKDAGGDGEGGSGGGETGSMPKGSGADSGGGSTGSGEASG